MIRRRADFATGTATPIYVAVLEEIIDRNPDLLPRRTPDYPELRAAYARCRWIGPGRGWIDPVKECQGAVLGLDAAFGTLEEFRRRSIRLPDWGGVEDASAAARKPAAE